MRLRVAFIALAAVLVSTARPVWPAAFTSRYGASSTLLPDGNILIIGGQTADGPPPTLTNSVQMALEGRDDYQAMSAAAPYVDRTSHTATLLPTGEVLVAGGIDGTNAALASVQIFNPRLNCWSSSLSLTLARLNHTATLLKNGSVLICGGNDTVTTIATCQLYQQAVPAEISCGGAPGGTLSASISMLVPRALHTATLLSDGRVFISGGLDTSGVALNPYLVTNELYNPTSNTMGAATSLITSRAYHRATLMGNGKVLITGGFNNRDFLANRGYLESVEIYDPVADTMSPAAPLKARKQQHSANINADGSVSVFGGLGNVATTYIMAGFAGRVDGGSIDGCFAPADCPGNFPPAVTLLSTMAISGGSYSLPVEAKLVTEVTGIIQEGSILFSSPSIRFPGGIAYLTPGAETTGGVRSGTIGDLAGTRVFCKVDGTCGHFSRVLTIPASGQYFITPDITITGDIPTMIATSVANWTPAVEDDGVVNAPLASSSKFTGQITITGLPSVFIGHLISSGVFHVTDGDITIPDSVDIELMDGWANIPAGTPITQAVDGSGRFIATIEISSFNSVGGGLVTATTDTPQSGPLDVSGAELSDVSGKLKFVVDGLTLSNDPAITFNVVVATVVIRRMVFADIEEYIPRTNVWAFKERGFGPQRFGHAATLTPNGDLRMHGGRTCSDPFAGQSNCPSLVTVGSVSVIPTLGGFTQPAGTMLTPRGNHTSTLLPDGKLLVAGGSNGPNVLATAELFDPELGTFSGTGSMNEPRDLHTATLLPNGRVLVAGGFTTNAVSTAATSSVELYFPNPGVWIRTSTLPFASDNHTATLLPDGNVLVAGGYSNGVYLETAAIYYSTSGTWSRLPDMPVKRALHTATLLQDGRVLFVGGINQTGVLCTTMIFDRNDTGATRPWVVGAPLNVPSCSPTHSHSATSLKDGRVLVAGGNDGFGETDLSAIYTPTLGGVGSWANTAATGNQINHKRFNHSAMLLPNGVVMIAGGAQALGNSITAVETFDVSASSWQNTGPLATARANMTMNILKDGMVTAVGGFNGLTMETSFENNYFAGSPDSQSLGVDSTVRQSSIASVDMSPFREGSFVTIRGLKLLGVGEASGGASASGNSSHHNPRLVLQSVAGSGGSNSQASGEFTLDLTTQIYAKAAGGDPNLWTKADTSMTIQMPPSTDSPYPGLGGRMLPYGWYHLRAYTNSVYSDSLLVQAGPPKPPGAPTAATGTVQGASSITWTWAIGSDGLSLAPRNFDGYNVYFASSGVFITTVPYDRPYFTQTGLGPNEAGAIVVAGYTLSGDGPLRASSTYFTLASSVTTLSFSNVGFGSLQLNWNANGNAPGTIYEVSQSTDDFALNFSTPVPTLLELTTTFVLIDFLQTNTTYFYRVRAFNGEGVASAFSVTASTRTRAPVTELSGSALNTTSIEWNWDDPGGQRFFNVYNATTGVVIATTAASTFVDLHLSTNSRRSVMVSAVTDAGEGPLSPSATVFTLAAAPGLVPLPIIFLSTGSFTAVWTANGNPTNTVYELQIIGDSGVVLATTTTTGFSGSYGLFPLAASVFSAQARAINGDDLASDYTVLGTSSTLARAPSSLTLTATTASSISVAWSTNNNSSSATYEVTFSSDAFATIRTARSFSDFSNLTSITIDGLLTSTTYSIRVQGQNIFGTRTAFSNSVTTSPFNGGVPFGSLGILVHPGDNTVITGSIDFPARAVTLRIAPYTFLADTFVTISTFTVPPSPCPNGTPIGISITPSPYVQPLKPMFFTLAYTDAELAGVPTSQAALMRVDGARCVPLLTSVNAGAHQLTAQLNHLSQFQVAQVIPAGNPDHTVAFPNPFYASRGNGYVTFSQMPAGARVRIFTMRGETLFDQLANASGLLTWPGTNQWGRSAASGVYLATIESGGEKKIIKLVVLR